MFIINSHAAAIAFAEHAKQIVATLAVSVSNAPARRAAAPRPIITAHAQGTRVNDRAQLEDNQTFADLLTDKVAAVRKQRRVGAAPPDMTKAGNDAGQDSGDGFGQKITEAVKSRYRQPPPKPGQSGLTRQAPSASGDNDNSEDFASLLCKKTAALRRYRR